MPQSGTQPALLVTKSEAANLLGVSRDTIWRLCKAGVLEDVRLHEGAHPRLRREDVLALAATRGRDGGSP